MIHLTNYVLVLAGEYHNRVRGGGDRPGAVRLRLDARGGGGHVVQGLRQGSEGEFLNCTWELGS